jgi:hypothetical protein
VFFFLLEFYQERDLQRISEVREVLVSNSLHRAHGLEMKGGF